MNAPHLTATATALVLGAGMLHASWNAVASAVDDKVVVFGLFGVSYSVVAAVVLPFAGIPRSTAIVYAGGSATLHVVYNVALLQSYRLGAFGQAYPLARGTSPLLVAAGAWVFAGEHLSGWQLAGIATIAVGLVSIVGAGGRLIRDDVPAIGAALLTGVAIASYTVVDGLGVRHSHNPLGYTALLFLLQGPFLAAGAALLRRGDRSQLQPGTAVAGLTAGLLSLLAYAIVIWAQTQGPLALVSALRETSVISAAAIATLVFREPFGRRRFPSAITVVAGIVLMSL